MHKQTKSLRQRPKNPKGKTAHTDTDRNKLDGNQKIIKFNNLIKHNFIYTD